MRRFRQRVSWHIGGVLFTVTLWLGAIWLFARAAPHLSRALPLVILISGLLVGAAVRRIAWRLSRPIEQLTEATRRFGAGELAYRIPVPPARPWPWRRRRGPAHAMDEMYALSRAWNDMAGRIEGQVRGQRELLANVSHELRSPLARIRVALELLDETGVNAARVRDVQGDLAELDRLIDDVLTAARLDGGALPARLEQVDVGPLLEGLVSRAGLDPATQGRTVRADAGTVESIIADGALLRRALWNLVENAAKYGAPPIVLSAERRGGNGGDGDDVVLAVTDAGPGIPVEDRARLLEPFQRGDRARTPGKGGVGLGLTIARRVAEAHGGSIAIEDPAGGATGCRVALRIPAKPPAS